MRLQRLRVQNYRVLRDVTLKELTPLTVLTGANGSGKSTLFDVFAFLNECFTLGLRPAWDARNRIEAIRSREQSGSVAFELAYRAPDFEERERVVTYQLSVDQDCYLPLVRSDKLRWSTSPGSGRPRDILSFEYGRGQVYDEESGRYSSENLASPDLLAVSALGQFTAHPRVRALRDFVQGWYLSYVSADGTRTTPTAGPERRLSQSGDNLANVIQFLEETYPDRLKEIFQKLSQRVPQVEDVRPQRLADGRLLLRLKDKPFKEPIISRFASDGTLKLLAYLVVLNDPTPFPIIGIEEPENQLHPRLLPILAEEIRGVSSSSQVFVTTHSTEFLAAILPRELWMIRRGDDGYSRVMRARDDSRVMAMMENGAQLGSLWPEGYLSAADPLGAK